MSRIKIHIEDIVGIAGNDYRLVRDMPEGKLLRSVDGPANVEFFDNAELEQVLEEGMLSIRRQSEIPTSADHDVARFRQVACEAFLDLNRGAGIPMTEKAIQAALPEIHAAWFQHCEDRRPRQPNVCVVVPRPPNAASMRRWLARYDGTAASLVVRRMTRLPGDPLESFDKRVANVVRQALRDVCGPRRLPVTHAYMIIRAHVRSFEFVAPDELPPGIPSLSTFRRIVNRMPREPARTARVSEACVAAAC